MVQWERKACKRLEAKKCLNMMSVEVDVSDNDGDDAIRNGDNDGVGNGDNDGDA